MHKYLYIDDTFDKIEKGTVNGIQRGGKIEVNHIPPGIWEQEILELIKVLPNYSGLIVDLRLNDMPYEGEKRAQYRGSTIATEVRTLVKEKRIEVDIPIFLISADQKLEESLDKTSYDLFDSVISKNTLGDGETGITYNEFIDMLVSFADGYQSLQHSKEILTFLRLETQDCLDLRFLEELKALLDYPNHVIIRFLNKQFLQKTTQLVSEGILAARLGIDSTCNGWIEFKESLMKEFKYKGILTPYFERWWWPEVENWWKGCIDNEFSLRSLSAGKRVELLIEKIKIDGIKPQIKSEKSQSDKFWTVCKSRKIAIDTIDGFLIAGQDNLYPWQEKEYISVDEALRPKNHELWKDIATTEKNRLIRLKDFYENASQRTRR